jgi:hypothetical protein
MVPLVGVVSWVQVKNIRKPENPEFSIISFEFE